MFDITTKKIDEARLNAIKKGEGYLHALHVDEGPHPLTRKAACDEGKAWLYARDIDKEFHPLTYEAACRDGDTDEYVAIFGCP